MRRLGVNGRGLFVNIKVIIDGVEVLFFIFYRETIETLKVKKFRLIGFNERGESYHTVIWVRTFSNIRFSATTC